MAKKSISQFTQADSVNPGDLLMISQLSGGAYVTRSTAVSSIGGGGGGGEGNTITFDDRINGVVGQNDLSVVHLDSESYGRAYLDGQLLSNALYVIEDRYINAFSAQIKNVAAPSASTDAATKGYVDSIAGDIETLINAI